MMHLQRVRGRNTRTYQNENKKWKAKINTNEKNKNARLIKQLHSIFAALTFEI